MQVCCDICHNLDICTIFTLPPDWLRLLLLLLMVGARTARQAVIGEPVSSSSDVYSFAMVLYELITADSPLAQFLQQNVDEKVPPLPPTHTHMHTHSPPPSPPPPPARHCWRCGVV